MSTASEIAAGSAVELFLAAMAVGLLYRVWGSMLPLPQKRVIPALHCGVILQPGRQSKVVQTGSHWIWPKQTLVPCDMRPKPFQVPSQELLTADGLGTRISLAGEYRIEDPALFVSENSDSFAALYLDLRQALHAAVRESEGAALFAQQDSLTARIKELLVPRAAQLGIQLTQLNIFEAMPVGWLRPT